MKNYFIALDFKDKYKSELDKKELSSQPEPSWYKKLIKNMRANFKRGSQLDQQVGVARYFEDMIEGSKGFVIEFNKEPKNNGQVENIEFIFDAIIGDKEVRKYMKSAKYYTTRHWKLVEEMYKYWSDDMNIYEIRYIGLALDGRNKVIGDETFDEIVYATNKKSALKKFTSNALNEHRMAKQNFTTRNIKDDILYIKEIKSDGGIIGFLNQKF